MACVAYGCKSHSSEKCDESRDVSFHREKGDMLDTEDLVEYFSTLRRGYDRVEFSEHIKKLNVLVDSAPLAPEDFNRLFRTWLGLEIPISSWIKIGVCLVPAEPMVDNLIRYSAKWLLAGLQRGVSVSRLGFLLSWLTAALDHEMVNAKVMDECYIIFRKFFEYDRHANSVAKLLYKLTKPHDITRYWTQYLLNLLQKRCSSRDKAQIIALLNLYKSYKPECVPENIGTVSVHNAFPKLNAKLIDRFQRIQDYRNHIDAPCKWQTNLREMGILGRGIKVRPLIPNMEFINIGSELYSGTKGKNLLHFNDPTDALTHSLRHRVLRPAQLLSMLCNETGALLLCTLPKEQHAFFSHDLKHQLSDCFLREDRVHRYEEKADFLCRVARLQQVMMQAIPVVTCFLNKYLCLWNGCHYAEEIAALLEWVQPESAVELRACILEPLEQIYGTVPELERFFILRTLTTMYNNMAYSNTRTHLFFLNSAPTCDFSESLTELAHFIQSLCLSSLRMYPGNISVLLSVLSAYEEMARTELAHSAPVCTVLPPPAVSLVLASPSAHSLNTMARVILMERKVLIALRRKVGADALQEQSKSLTTYKIDLRNCLWRGTALTSRSDGLILSRLPQNRVDLLLDTFPDADKGYTLGRSLALAPYTYLACEGLDVSRIDNEVWLEKIVRPHFSDLAKLIEVMLKGRSTGADGT